MQNYQPANKVQKNKQCVENYDWGYSHSATVRIYGCDSGLFMKYVESDTWLLVVSIIVFIASILIGTVIGNGGLK